MTNQRKLIRKAKSILRVFERNREDLRKQGRCEGCGAHPGEFHLKPTRPECQK